MSIRRSLLFCLGVSFLLVGATATGLTLATDGGDRPSEGVGPASGPGISQLLPQTEEVPEADATVTRIAVTPDGTAEWTFTVRIALDTNASSEEFDAFQEEFAANRSQFVDRFRDRMTTVVDNARTDVDREMAVTGFEAETGTEQFPQRWGFLSYRFNWTGFAVADEESVSVGDVFEGGLFLQENDLLFVDGPAGYRVASVDPAPDQRDASQLQWDGPRSFADERPQVQFTTEGSNSGTETPGSSDDGSTPENGLFLPVSLLAAGVVAAGLAFAVVYAQRRSDAVSPNDGRTSESATQDAPAGPETDAADGPPADGLVTDADRVVALLEEEGGRMRQAAIADRLGWSDSKTSRVLSAMAEEGTVEKLRIGRENVIDLRSTAEE